MAVLNVNGAGTILKPKSDLCHFFLIYSKVGGVCRSSLQKAVNSFDFISG